jgi:hypothetical protein
MASPSIANSATMEGNIDNMASNPNLSNRRIHNSGANTTGEDPARAAASNTDDATNTSRPSSLWEQLPTQVFGQAAIWHLGTRKVQATLLSEPLALWVCSKLHSEFR